MRNYSEADLHSKILDAPPPQGPNSFNFMQFLGNFWQNRMLDPPLGNNSKPAWNCFMAERNVYHENQLICCYWSVHYEFTLVKSLH